MRKPHNPLFVPLALILGMLITLPLRAIAHDGPVDPFQTGVHLEFTQGTINEMSGDAQLMYMEGTAEINDVKDEARIHIMRGNAKIDTLGRRGQPVIDTMSGNAFIKKAMGNSGFTNVMGNAVIETVQGKTHIVKFQENARIGHLTGLSTITLMEGGTIDVMDKNTEQMSPIIIQMTAGTINTMSSGTIEQMMDNASIKKMTGGTINNFFGGKIEIMNNGTIKNLAITRDEIAIDLMNGGIINDMSNGHIGQMQNGQIDVMSGGKLEVMHGGIIDNLSGDGTIKTLHDGTVNTMTGGKIEDMKAGIIDSMSDGFIRNMSTGTINTMTGGLLAQADNLTIGSLSGGIIDFVKTVDIDTMTNGKINTVTTLTADSISGGMIDKVATLTLDTMSGGLINDVRNAQITSLSGGTIDSVGTLDLDTMSGGRINGVSDSRITSMSGGFIDYMMDDSTIDTMSGGMVGKMRTNARIDSMSGGAIGILLGGAQVNSMSGGFIDEVSGGNINKLTDGAITSFSSGRIGLIFGGTVYTMHDGWIETLTGGAINTMAGGTITTMREGAIGTMYGGEITSMQTGTINNMYGGLIHDILDGTINYMSDGVINNLGNGTINNMANGVIKNVTGGNINFSGQHAQINNLSRSTNLGFHIYGPTDHAKLTFQDGDTTDGTHTVSLINMAGPQHNAKGNDFSIELIDESAITGQKDATYTLADGKTRFGVYDYALSGLFDNDIFSVQFHGLGMNKSAKKSLASGVGGGMSAGFTQVMTANNTVGKRLGDLRLAGLTGNEDAKNGLWLRQYARHTNIDGFEHTDVDTYGIEGGYDRKLSLDMSASIHLGVALGMGWSDVDSSSADIDVSGPSAGIYGTMLFDNGWYADVIARYHWLKMDSDVKIFGNSTDSFDKHTDAISFTLETGKQIVWEGENHDYFVQPRLQYNYTHIDGYSGTVHNVKAKAKDFDSSLLTAGVDAGMRFTTEGGSIIEPFVKLNAKQEFDGTTRVKLDSTKDRWSLSGFRGEGGLGVNMQLTNGLSVYAEGTYEKGERYESAGGNLGFRFAF